MTFVVHLPANTPATDEVTFWGDGNWTRAMDRLGGDSARVVLSKADFNLDGTLKYRYTRNGSNFIGAEYLLPDRNQYFWEDYGRNLVYSAGGVREDTVARWRWFPEGDITPPEPSIDAPVPFVARISGRPFQPGVFFQDLYESWFSGLFEPSAQYLSARGYGMAALAPPWHVSSLDPPAFGQDMSYPEYTAESLAAQIQALKNHGIEVVVQPQLDPGPSAPTGASTAWWDTWFAQLGDFLVYHAQIAESAGATWFSFFPYGQDELDPPADIDTRFRAVLARVREVFHGSVGVTFEEFSGQDGADYLNPSPEGLSWADAVDFVVFQSAGEMVNTTTATTTDLVNGALRILAPVRALAEGRGIPVLILPVYASVAQSWRGTSFYQVTLANAPYDGEDEWDQGGTYSFSEQDQARVLDAWYRVAAQVGVVQSVLPFGYWNMDMPLEPGFSIRGKSAERVVELWK